jgi:hypothetical protein
VISMDVVFLILFLNYIAERQRARTATSRGAR